MSIYRNHLPIMGASGAQSTGYEIEQSIRFNDGDSAYMHRTPSGAGNRRTFTYSLWFKLGDMASTQRMLLSVRNSDTTRDNIIFNQGSSGDFKIYFDARVSSSAHTQLEPTRVFRDPSAWYHLIVAVDTTDTTEHNRVRFYINGIQETNFTTTNYPGLNQQFQINNTDKHSIGRFEYSSVSGYWDGYLAEIHLIDGYAYGPEYFGEFNSSNIWIPKEYSESYGTNGFKIDGRDSSDLGDDESGNGNDFTTSGLAAHDQVADSPTNNFCTGLPTGVGNATGVAFSEGNLTGKTSGTAGNWVSSIPVDSGKWYFEVNNHAQGSGNNLGIGQTPGGSYHHFALGSGGNQINDYDIIVNTGASGSIVGFKLDFDAGTLTHTTDGTSYSSTGSLTSNMSYAAFARLGSSSGHVAFNFGQDSTFGGLETAGGNSDSNGIGDFYYNVPSGFLAICSKNLGS